MSMRMTGMGRFFLLVVALCATTNHCSAFQKLQILRQQKTREFPTTTSLFAFFGDRRRFLLSSVPGAAVASLLPSIASAGDEDAANDLASTLFNPDGSVKEGVETEAKFRPVDISWDVSDSAATNVDGVDVGGTQKGSSVKVGYLLPDKWADASDSAGLYFDRSEGVNSKACRRISVLRAPGEVKPDVLDKATRVGVAKALNVPDDLNALSSADLISGRTRKKDGVKYYDFDMAVAPASCDKSKDDLGLGFCSYDSIYLLSATVVDDHLYFICLESDKDQWKRANSDLKVVRSTFSVSPS